MAILMIDRAYPRLSFKCHGPVDKARKWDIRLGSTVLGSIDYNDQVPHEGTNARTWNITLTQGFDPLEFELIKVGTLTDRPYLTCVGTELVLYNPCSMTTKEAKLWIRHIIQKANVELT